MEGPAIAAAVRDILIEQLQAKPAQVAALTPDTPLLGRGLGLDSMEVLTLAVAIEERFSIQIADEELTPDLFRTLDSLVACIQLKLDPAASPDGRTE
ncbi:MAG: phosphopantetheine-binding protein [Acidobacteriota bacterium]